MIIDYNRQLALNYAQRWSLSRNPEYYDYSQIGGDCTNFISQCVYAGIGVMNYTPDFGWYYINANNKSPAWTGVDYFYNFITTNESFGPFGEEKTLSQLELGDVIQIGNENYTHSLLLTGILRRRRFNIYFVSAHSQDAYMRNLNSYRFNMIRGIHIIGGRI